MGNFSEFGAQEWGGRIAEQDQQATLVSALKALETLGSIAQQPAALAQKQSIARWHNAQAGKLEAGARDEQAMANIAASVSLSESDRPLAQMAELARKANLYNPMLKLLDADAALAQKGAATASSIANRRVRELTASAEALKIQGALAGSILAGGESAYQSYLQSLGIDGYDTSGYPTTFEKAAPLLRSMQLRSSIGLEQLKFEQKKLVDAAEIARDQAAAVSSMAAAKSSAANAERIGLIVTDIEKHDGDTTRGAREANNQLTESRKAAERRRVEADERVADVEIKKRLRSYAPAPISPTERILNKTYVWPDGAIVRWEMNPATKMPGPRILVPAVKQRRK